MAFVPYKKKDKKHRRRENPVGNDLDLPVPKFEPLDSPSKHASGLPQIGDDGIEEDDQGPGLAQKIMDAASLSFLVGADWLKKASMSLWNGVVWSTVGIGNGFRKIGSYLVWKSEDDEEGEETVSASIPSIATAAAVDVPDFDDDEKFSWLSAGTKLAVLATAAFLVVGGYFGVKTFLGKKGTETIAQAPVKSTVSNENTVSTVASPVVASANPLVASTTARPQEKPAEKQQTVSTTAKPQKKPAEKPQTASTTAKPREKPAEKPQTVSTTAKPQEKPTEKQQTASTTAKPQEKTTEKQQTASTTAKPQTATAIASVPPKPADDPWAIPPTTVSSPQDNAWEIPASSTTAVAEPTVATAPSSGGFPALAPPDTQASPVIASPAIASLVPPPVSPLTQAESPVPLLASLQPLALPTPATDAEKPPQIPDPASPELKPLIVPPSPSVASSFDAVERKPDFPTASFAVAPTPPDKDVPLAEPAINALPFLSPTPPIPESVPKIPTSGTVAPVAVSATPPPQPNAEPSPRIPQDPITGPESTATFTVPNISSPIPYVPPTVNAPVPPTPPAGFIPPPLTVAASSSATTPTEPPPNAPIVQETMPEKITVAPLETEQQRLAEAVPPLGTQLKHEIREIRQTMGNPESTVLGFSPPPVTAMGGAVRYGSQTAPPNTVPPLPIPNEPENPSSNQLLALNPSANALADVPGLPPLQSAPPVVLAVPGPKYQLPNDTEGSATYRRKARTVTSAPDAKRYVVEPGDTYMTISTRFYETSLLYRALALHNRRLGASWLPEPGTELEIPPSEYLQANYGEVLSGAGERGSLPVSVRQRSPSPIATAVATTLPTARQGIRYVVREGDTVFKIAEERLKDTGRWRDIILWNRDQIQDARDLRPGMEIILPEIVSTSARVR